MATDHRRVGAQVAQGVMLDEPDFLRELVERVLQEVLEAVMTERIGPLPTSVPTPARASVTATSPGRFAPGWER